MFWFCSWKYPKRGIYFLYNHHPQSASFWRTENNSFKSHSQELERHTTESNILDRILEQKQDSMEKLKKCE